MRVSMERSGGFAGRTVRKEVDSNSLSELQQRRLRKLVDESGFFALPARLESLARGADMFRYRITIETGETTHTVEGGEAALPPGIRPLLDWLAHHKS